MNSITISVCVIAFLFIFSLIVYVKLKRKAVYIKKKKIPFPDNGLEVDLKQHYPTLRFDYIFHMNVKFTGGSQKSVILFKGKNTVISLNMFNGSIKIRFIRFPSNKQNFMEINTLSIIPFQRNIVLKIKQDLRNIEILVNNTSKHSETLEYIPYIHPKISAGILLPKGGSRYVILKKFDFKVL